MQTVIGDCWRQLEPVGKAAGRSRAEIVEDRRADEAPARSGALTAECNSDAKRLAAEYARLARAGLLLFCPSGNEASAEPTYPAAYPGCIAIAALDRGHRLAEFSGYGEWVHTAAPGVDISVAVGEADYRSWSGTSFSCAVAAGVAAHLVRANPKLSGEDIRRILRTTGVPVIGPSGQSLAAPIRALDAYECLVRVRAGAVGNRRADGRARRRG